jgi:predicted CopG family antitoxin
VVGSVGEKRTTIPVSERTHLELYALKRKMRAKSFDDVLRRLIKAYRRRASRVVE